MQEPHLAKTPVAISIGSHNRCGIQWGDDRMREWAGKVYGLGKIEYLQCGTVREQYGFYYDFLVSIGTPVN